MGAVVSAGFLIGLMAMLFYTPALYAKGILKMSYDDLTTGEKIMCWVPVLNVSKAEKLYTGKFSLVGTASILVVLSIIFRLVAVFVLTDVTLLQFTTVALFLLSIVFYFVSNVYSVFIVLHDCNIEGAWWRAILFPFGQYYIGTYLNRVIKNAMNEEKTF